MISGNITLLQGKVGLEPCTQKSGCQMPFSLNRVVRKHTVTLNFCGLVQYVVGKHQYFPPCYVFVFFFRLPGNRYSMLWRSESRKSLWVIPNHHCGLVWTVCEQILSTQGSGSTIFIYCATSLSVPFFFGAYHKASFKLATPHHIHAATCSSYILISLVLILARIIGLIGDCFTSWAPHTHSCRVNTACGRRSSRQK